MLNAAGGVERLDPLEPLAKVEGVAAEAADSEIELLLVADADDPDAASPLLAATI